MKAAQIAVYGALGYGLYCLLAGGKSEAAARADQDNVLLPKIVPTGSPERTADNPLSDDEKQAIAAGAAYLNKNGWLTYVGFDDKSSSGSVAW